MSRYRSRQANASSSEIRPLRSRLRSLALRHRRHSSERIALAPAAGTSSFFCLSLVGVCRSLVIFALFSRCWLPTSSLSISISAVHASFVGASRTPFFGPSFVQHISLVSSLDIHCWPVTISAMLISSHSAPLLLTLL
jgi:hypothetical protein